LNDSSVADKELELFIEQITSPDRIQISIPDPRKKVIIISGPTAVGKTALSLAVARAIGGEVISADSMQVYKGMDVGTAKVTVEERDSIPHHLIDVREVNQAFNVVDFYQEASLAIDAIHKKGAIPVVVGGTGFYLHSLIYGPPMGPPSIAALRAQLEAEIEERGSGVLYERLQKLDPEYARTITRNDKHKIVRALEIISSVNKKVSDFSKASLDTQKYDFRSWFLYKPKEILYRLIDQRCDQMLENGLLDEVRRLKLKGLCDNTSASQAIGYRQCLEFLSSPQHPDDWDQLVLSFKQASRRYAKRQFTWFRKEPLFRWLDTEEISFERSAEIILQDFELSF
jgi:tRNA dimethylallyltransferase